MGNRPKPTALKILQGNPGHKPLNLFEPKPRDVEPRMPAELKAYPFAVKEWKREAKELRALGLFKAADTGAFAKRCMVAHFIEELAERANTGELSAFTHLKTMLAEHRQLGGVLGLDPVSRTRLKSDVKSKPKSALEDFMARKNG